MVAYDSPCDKRRRKLAQKLIHPEQDRLRLWPLSRRCCARIVNLGIDVPAPGFSDIVI